MDWNSVVCSSVLWWGDILMIYALVGLAALPFARRDPLSLVKWAFFFFLAHFLICTGFVGTLYAWGHAAAAPGAPGHVGAGFANFIASLSDSDHPAIRSEFDISRGGFARLFLHHVALFGGHGLNILPFVAFHPQTGHVSFRDKEGPD